MHCLLRSCFEDEDENGVRENRSYEPPRPATSSRMVRSVHYESTSHEDNDEEDDDGDCCRPEPGADAADGGLHLFWKNLRDRWKTYETLEPVEGDISPQRRMVPQSTDVPFQTAPFGIFRRTPSGGVSKNPAVTPSLLSLSRSPLRAASSFGHSRGVPSINAEEVVMPGSALQHQMAAVAAGTLEEQGDECVICMEGFDPTNPRMPTLCGCGENKTYFHLPCLYQWIEQSRECPSCRKRLRWEEF